LPIGILPRTPLIPYLIAPPSISPQYDGWTKTIIAVR